MIRKITDAVTSMNTVYIFSIANLVGVVGLYFI